MRCAAASSICSRPAWANRCGSIFSATRLESIRSFDPETQRTNADLRALDLVPMAEFQLTSDTIRLFRTGYVAAFGAAAPDDVLYEAVSEGRRYAGMEHWLPLFHQRLETLFDYLGATPVAHRAAGRGSRPRAARADRRLLPGAQRARSIRPAPARPTSRCRRTGSISPKPNGASAWSVGAGAADAVRGARAARTRSRSPRAPATISPPSAASPTRTCSRR